MKLLLSHWTYDDPVSFDHFYHMPPGSYMKDCCSDFVPDYPLLLLFEEFVGSSRTFHLVHENKYYGEVAQLWDALLAEGRLTLHDFDETKDKYKDVIETSVAYDLRNLDAWFPAFRSSVREWRKYRAGIIRALRRKQRLNGLSERDKGLLTCVRMNETRDFMVPKDAEWNVRQVFGSWRKRLEPTVRQDVYHIAEQYFRYIAGNIILCQDLDATLHDWADIGPLYEMKLSVGLATQIPDGGAEHVRQLFRLVFPEFKPKSVRSFMKALADPRIESLRNLVTQAAAGTIQFDDTFATDVFRCAFEAERKLGVKRAVIGWLSLPIGLLPGVGNAVQKGIEESLGLYLRKKAEKHAPWLYLVSSINDG